MNKHWNEKTLLEKIADIISAIAVGVWLICEILSRTNSLAHADIISYISILVIAICQAFSFWRENRVISYIALGGVACMIVTLILMLI